MRRRPKRGPNVSESTGKIGQELPSDQRRPLRPEYPERAPAPEPGVVVTPLGDVALNPAVSYQATPDEESSAPQAVHNEVDAAPTPARPPRDGGRHRRPRGEPAPGPMGGAVISAASSPNTGPDAAASGEVEGKLVVETQPELLSTPPPEPSAARLHKGFVVLTIGLPGSGKTTWFKRRGVTPLSSDMLRNILFDDITEQRYQGLVFSTLRSLLRARLIAKMPWNYVDATNLSPHERRQWIKMAKSFGYDVQAVFFDVPFEVCMERNRKRERTVNDEIMQKMNERLRPPSFKEGFSKITVVRVKGASQPGISGAAPDGVEVPDTV